MGKKKKHQRGKQVVLSDTDPNGFEYVVDRKLEKKLKREMAQA
jgi:hypothetical protein